MASDEEHAHDEEEAAPKRLVQPNRGDSDDEDASTRKHEQRVSEMFGGFDSEEDGDDDEQAAGHKGGKKRKERPGADDEPAAPEKRHKGAPTDPDRDQPNEEDRAFINDEGQQPEWVNPDGSDSEESREGSDAPEAEEVGEDEAQEAIDKVANRGKRKRLSAHEVLERERETKEQLTTFLSMMDRAAEADISSNESMKPALHKLNMLEEVLSVTSKKQFQTFLLDGGLLRRVRQWMVPLPDGSLPNIQIRTALLNILLELPCETDQLKDSHVGEVVMMCYNNKQETRRNRTLAKKIIEKWSRPLFGLNTRYTGNEVHELEPSSAAPEARAKERTPTKKGAVVKRSVDEALDTPIAEVAAPTGKYRWHAEFPHAPNFNYKVAAPDRVASEKRHSRPSASRRVKSLK